MAGYIVRKLRTLTVSFWAMLCVLFIFIVGNIVPVYFENNNWRKVYYVLLAFTLLASTLVQLTKYITRNNKINLLWSIPWSLILFGIVFLLSFILVLGTWFDVWSTAGTYYVNKKNPEVKIIRRYVDQGAFGGGTSPNDYFTVLHRPFTPWFKIETLIDTNKIDKAEWVKPRNQY